VAQPSIMPLGDSLTAPYVPTLARLLTQAKVPFRLVGTQGSGALRHEGHGGYRVQMIASALDGYLASIGETPGYAVVCLGTNDLVSMPFPDVPKILSQWEALIGSLRARGVRVLVCTVPRTTVPNSPGIAAFNAGVRSYAKRNSARLHLADLERALSLDDLSADGVHLSPAGAERMGRVIARAFSSKVPASGTSKNPITAAADELKRRRVLAIGTIVVLGTAVYFWR